MEIKKLERKLGLKAIIAISISSMLGSGIFVLPGLAFQYTGPSVWLAYLLSSLCVLPAAISKSELATAMPTSGGTYVYLERSFGPFIGTVAGLGLWLSLLLKSAFALIGIGAYLSLFTTAPLIPTALSLLTIICVLNILGIGKVSNALIVIVIITISALALLSVNAIVTLNFFPIHKHFPQGFSGLLKATSLVFVSYAGVTKVAAIAEEITEPEKNLPRGILISLLIVTCLYCGVNIVLARTIPVDLLAGNLRPIHSLASKVGGNIIAIIISVIAVSTMGSMANAGILASSRFPFAMARDKLLPSILGKLHSRFLTPVSSILISSIVVALVLLTMDVAKIAKLASAFMLIIYVSENFAVIILRESRVQWYQPVYKSPLYPFVQVFGVVSGLVLLASMKMTVTFAVVSIGVPGILIYFFYSRHKTDRKGVLGIRGIRKDLITDSALDLDSNKLENINWEKQARVVVPLFGKERSPEMLIEMAAALADGQKLEVAHITEIPEQTDLNDIQEENAKLRSLRRRVLAMAVQQKIPLQFDPVISHDILKSVFEISQRLHCQWLLVEWGGKTTGAFTIHNPVGWLRDHLHCNLGIFRDSGVRYIRKILVVLKDDVNDGLVIETSTHLAKVHNAVVTLSRYIPSQSSQDELQKEYEILNDICSDNDPSWNSRILQAKSFSDSVIEASAEYDLVIFGIEERQYTKLKNRLLGSEDDRITSRAACSVLKVQSSSVDTIK